MADRYMDDDEGKPRRQRGLSKFAQEARTLAQKTGKLPHEILLDIARGVPIGIPRIHKDSGELIWVREGVPLCDYVVPQLDNIIDAAKAAAPYFAPKISTVEVIQGVSDHELDRIIESAAAEAGLSLSSGGEGEEDEGSESAAASDSPRVRLKLD